MRLSSRRVSEALSAAGAQLKRAGRHLVYQLPNNRIVVLAATPSDHRAEQNMLRDIRHATGVVKPAKPVGGARPKTAKPGRVIPEKWGLPQEVSPMAMALRQTGLVEQQLRTRIGHLEALVVRQEEQIARLERLVVVRAWRAAQLIFNLKGTE